MKFLRLLFVPVALAIVLVIRLIAPWKLVRFGEHWDSRLGHLVGNTECYLCEKDAGIQPKAFDIWASIGTSNECIEKKYRKLLHIYPTWLVSIVSKVNVMFSGWDKHYIRTTQLDRDVNNLWEIYSPHIGFTELEERKGQALLRSLGIQEGAKWVCLFVRDSAYLKAKMPGLDFSYHDYRDSDIDDCIPAVKKLVENGYYVVRMGEIVEKSFDTAIDYSLSGKRTDFGDLYLCAKCKFFFGTSSGLMAIAQAFYRPVGVINYVPLEYLPTYANGLAIWKHHFKDGKELSVEEIGEAGKFMSSRQFEAAGITLKDNTPTEIYELADEMCNRLDESQTEFWDKFPRSLENEKPLHGNIRLRIGREFLKSHEKQSPKSILERMAAAEEIGIIEVMSEARKIMGEKA